MVTTTKLSHTHCIVGAFGQTYRFYTVARDNVGHVGAAPVGADAVISPLAVEAGSNLNGNVGANVSLPNAVITYSGNVALLTVRINWGDGSAIEAGSCRCPATPSR